MDRVNGLFAPPPSAQEDRRQAIFLRFKALTVPILDHIPLRASSSGALVSLLGSLRQEIDALSPADQQVFNPALATYILFPLSRLFELSPVARLPDDVLRQALLVLASLARAWRSCKGGMQEAPWLELFGVGALAMGGPLQAGGGVKGKAKERALRPDNVLCAGMELLTALLRPVTPVKDEDDVIGVLQDLDVDSLLGQAKDDPASPRPPSTPTEAVPILVHALTALLDISTSESLPSRLRRSSLVCAKDVIRCMAAHRAVPPDLSSPKGRDLVASTLPGCVTATSRVCLGSQSKSDEVCAALELLETVVDWSLGESWPEIQALLQTFDLAPEEGRLEELVEWVERWKQRNGDPSTTPQPVISSQSNQSQSSSSRDGAWLTRTVHHLSLSLRLLLSALASHHHSAVRVAWTCLCTSCAHGLPTVLSLPVPLDGDSPANDPRDAEGLQVIVEALLRSVGDDWPDVSESARAAFSTLPRQRAKILQKVSEALSANLVGLARLVTRRDDVRVRVSATLVSSAIGVLSSPDRGSSRLPSSQGLERWSGPLLVALELDTPQLLHERRGGASSDLAARRAFKGVGPGSVVLLLDDTPQASRGDKAVFPSARFRNIKDPASARAVETMLVRLGDGAEALSGWPHRVALAEDFLALAARDGPSAKGLVALLVAVTSLEGFKKQTKAAKFAERVARALIELEADEDDAGQDSAEEEQPDSQELVRNENGGFLDVVHVKGNTALASERFTSLKPTSSSPREDARVLRESRRALRSTLILRGLAACASLLEDSFDTFLFGALYPILTHLVSPEPFVSSCARVALSRIAFEAGYAAPTNLILDNVDYVVHAVSVRLKLPDLDPDAPRVLVGMIQEAGSEVLPLIQDVVEECFDALERYHHYDFLCANLLAVFDALLRTVEQATEFAPRPKPTRFRKRRPDGQADRRKLQIWLEHRRTSEVEPGVDDFPPEYWQPSYLGDQGASSTAEREEDWEAEPPKPNKTQAICAEILSKSAPLLSHPSPFLRARVLDLLASGLAILGLRASSNDGPTRGKDLLGLVDRSWPILLNRLDLGLEDANVVAAACRFVEALVVHAGEFMGRKVAEDVWPRFKRILERREQDEARSARRRWEQTTCHRIAASILKTLAETARSVDLREDFAWEVSTSLLGFLRPVDHEELQRLARDVYVALAEENGDSVWLALTAAAGRVERMRYMAVEGVEANAELVLAEI